MHPLVAGENHAISKLFPVEIRRDHYLGAVKASQSRQSPEGRHFS